MAPGRKPFGDLFLTGVLVLAIAVVANVLLTRHLDLRFDLTAERENTLSAGTLKAIDALPDRARVRAYFTKDMPPEAGPHLDRAIRLVEQLARVSGGKIAVDYADPSEAKVVEEAKKLGILPFEFQSLRHDRAEQVSLYFGLEIRCADRPPKILPFLDPSNPEYEIARAFKSLGDERPPTVAFLTREPAEPPKVPGFEMPSSPERIFQAVRESVKDRFKVIDVLNTKWGDPIPEDVGVLVLARPKEIDERERFEIDQFVMRGGRLFILADRHEYDGGGNHVAKITTGLEPLLAKWGIAIPDDSLVVDEGAHGQVPLQVKGPKGTAATRFLEYPYFVSFSQQLQSFSTKHPITRSLQALGVYWASPIDVLPEKPPGIQVETLLQSSVQTWRTREVEDAKPAIDVGQKIGAKLVTAVPAREKLAVALVGKFPSLYAGKSVPALAESRPAGLPAPVVGDHERIVLTESRETRVLVVSDSDLIRNEIARQSVVFFANSIDWLSLDQDLIGIRSRGEPRLIRNLELDAKKAKGEPDAPKSMAISSAADLQKMVEEQQKIYEQRERVGLEAREEADRQRGWIKFANTFGPAALLLVVALVQLVRRRIQRARAAAAARTA